MKTNFTSTKSRAGVISLLVLAIAYLYVTPFSSQLHIWTFFVLVAVCFVEMMKLLIDLFVLAFDAGATLSGRTLGRVVRLIHGS